MTWLTSLPAAVLVIGGLALALLLAIGGRLAGRALVPAAEQDAAYTIAAPLMPALGALFALFMASPWPARPVSWPPRKGS